MRKTLAVLLVFAASLSVMARAAVPVWNESVAEGDSVEMSKPQQASQQVSQQAPRKESREESPKEQRKERRAQRMEEWKQDMREFNEGRNEDKKLNELLDSVSWVCAQTALNNCSFVVEAEFVAFKNGYRIPVNSGTNFISLDGDRAVVQISPSPVHSGPNGVGGVTVKGTASGIEKRTDKKGRIIWSMSVVGIGINAKVDISIVPGSNKVTATVLPNFSSNNLTLDGRLVPLENSAVFEGMPL